MKAFIEHTLLRPEATPADIARLGQEALTHGLFGVCVAPAYVDLARRAVGRGARVVTVAGFPLGSSAPGIKAAEARLAVADGADEVDMVMAIGLASSGLWADVEADIRTVRRAVPRAVLKVIVETGYFDAAAIARAAEAAVRAGADFVKTSTGYGPRGASVDDVRVLLQAVSGRAAVKASGGIRTAAEARALLDAGATRIGTSNGVGIVTGATAGDP